MKKVTKKLVSEILTSFTGWNFAYDFKESQKIFLFSYSNHVRITEHLSARDIEVVEYKPAETPITGFMKLRIK